MGLHQEANLTTSDLRKLYKQKSKRAFQIITQHISADCYPSETSVYDYYNLKSENRPIHPDVGGLPVKQGYPFSFNTITKEQLEATMKSLNKNSTPGRSNITYADILYCDPDLSIHLTLFN